MSQAMSKRVIANLVVAEDGSTTSGGSSIGLTTQRDRQRFHALRSSADLIIVGGSTARREPYEKTPVTLLVVTRGELDGRAKRNPLARAFKGGIVEAIQSSSGRILLECGRTLLAEAVDSGLVDELHFTYVAGKPDENKIDLTVLLNNFEEQSREEFTQETFVRYLKK